MRWVHPSNRRLLDWLESVEAGSVDDHVATCRRCAARLEDLATPVPGLGEAIRARLLPPDDLVDRLGSRMNESMHNREDLQIFLDLMGVPWRTVLNLMTEGEDE